MMKNQLADLMKQAQAMQDSMKKAQEAIAAMEDLARQINALPD